jgi:hypothetical protein
MARRCTGISGAQSRLPVRRLRAYGGMFGFRDYDVPTGTGAMTNVEYIPYHVCSRKTVTHKIYRDTERGHRICCCRQYPSSAIQRPT